MSQYNQLSIFDNPKQNKPLPELIADGGPDWTAFPLVFHDIDDTRFYSVQDWIRGVAQTDNARITWVQMKKRHPQLLNSIEQLPYVAQNGRTYQMDFATAEGLYLITQRMDANTGIRNKVLVYLAKAGVEIDEERRNPDKAIEKGLAGLPTRQLNGPHKDDPAWVEARLMGIVSRKEFTNALRDFVRNPDYPRATNGVYMGIFGMLASEIRQALNIDPKSELRNYISRPALMAIGYAEAWVSSTLVDYGDTIPMDVALAQISYIASEVGNTQSKLAANAGVDLLTGKRLLTDGKGIA